MTTDQLAFLAAIIDSPDDDLPRLVYADWLQDHDKKESVCPECKGEGTKSNPRHFSHYGVSGTMVGAYPCPRCSNGNKQRETGIIPGNGFAERAEFIRVQIELAKWPNGEYCPECGHHWKFGNGAPPTYWCDNDHKWIVEDHRELTERERELQPMDYTHHAQWKRGFVETITCPLQSWLESGPSIVREQPILKVVCTDKEPHERLGMPGGENYDWVFAPPIACYERWDIPKDLRPFFRIPEHVEVIGYLSQQAANDDLSQALIRYAKEQGITKVEAETIQSSTCWTRCESQFSCNGDCPNK